MAQNTLPLTSATAPRQTPTPSLKKNSAWMLGGQLLRSGVQLLYFILIARALGSQGYGSFIAVTALIAILGPFASWGSGNLLVQHVARNPATFPTYWGSAVATTISSALILSGLVMTFGQFALPHGSAPTLLLLIALSDLLCARLIDVSGQAFQAHQRLDRTAALQFLPSLLRLAAAGLLFLLPIPKTALIWAFFFLGSTALSTLIALHWVNKELGWGPLSLKPMRAELRTGGAYAVSLSAQSIYNDIDKTMLARMINADAAGIYAAAYRIIDVAFTPVRSLLYASYAKFFQHGQQGLSGTTKFALTLLPWAALYGVLSIIVLWVAAPLLPVLFGQDFQASTDALRWLAPLVLLKSLHYFAADTLTGAGHQSLRSGVQIAVAIANVMLNLWLIPQHGWMGAVWASLISDGMLTMLLIGTLAYKRRFP